MQRPRDRSRRQSQHVDLESERAEELFLRDTEALLLVEDDEAQVLRDHVAREDAVRADQDLDLPFSELVEDPRLIGAGAEARDHLHPHREVAIALAERVPMLLRENRRRAEDERLLLVHGGSERRPDGDLRLSEADVAADEPIHRPAAPRDPPSPPRSPVAGRPSPDTGTSFRAARASRWRGRAHARVPAGASRRERGARRRARAPRREHGS